MKAIFTCLVIVSSLWTENLKATPLSPQERMTELLFATTTKENVYGKTNSLLKNEINHVKNKYVIADEKYAYVAAQSLIGRIDALQFLLKRLKNYVRLIFPENKRYQDERFAFKIGRDIYPQSIKKYLYIDNNDKENYFLELIYRMIYLTENAQEPSFFLQNKDEYFMMIFELENNLNAMREYLIEFIENSKITLRFNKLLAEERPLLGKDTRGEKRRRLAKLHR